MYPKIIKDFVSQDEAKTIIDLLDPMTVPSPREGINIALGYRDSTEASKAGITEPVIVGMPASEANEATELLTDVFNRVKAKVEEIFGHEAALTQGNYQNMVIGGKNNLHSDTTDLDGNPLQPDGTPEEMEWSVLLYLNNHGVDFDGGSILFPKQNLEIFPVCGDLIVFPGDFEHIHEVPAVTRGERKNLVFFYGRPENIGSSDKNFYVWQDQPPQE
jgi:2OG-Fe(II) oxygenase superfamily